MFSNEDVSILSNLRSRTTRGIRKNLKNMYKDNLNCPLKCWPDGSPPVEDDQEHLLNCSKLKLKSNQTVACICVQYNDIYGDVNMQKVAVNVFKEVLETRNKLMEE